MVLVGIFLIEKHILCPVSSCYTSFSPSFQSIRGIQHEIHYIYELPLVRSVRAALDQEQFLFSLFVLRNDRSSPEFRKSVYWSFLPYHELYSQDNSSNNLKIASQSVHNPIGFELDCNPNPIRPSPARLAS